MSLFQVAVLLCFTRSTFCLLYQNGDAAGRQFGTEAASSASGSGGDDAAARAVAAAATLQQVGALDKQRWDSSSSGPRSSRQMACTLSAGEEAPQTRLQQRIAAHFVGVLSTARGSTRRARARLPVARPTSRSCWSSKCWQRSWHSEVPHPSKQKAALPLYLSAPVFAWRLVGLVFFREDGRACFLEQMFSCALSAGALEFSRRTAVEIALFL